MSINLRWSSGVGSVQGSNIYINENIGSNQEVLDFGNDLLNGWSGNGNSTYRITSGNSNHFNFDTSSGELFYLPNPDYEQQTSYNFTVEVTRPLTRVTGGRRKRKRQYLKYFS